MLLTSFYTYKKPPKDSTKPSASLADTPTAAEGTATAAVTSSTGPSTTTAAVTSSTGPSTATAKDDRVVPDIDDSGKEASEKKKDEKPATEEVDQPSNLSVKPVDQPDKPLEEEESSKVADDLATPVNEAPPPKPPVEALPLSVLVTVPPRTVAKSQKPRMDVTDLALLVKKILFVSEKVASVVSELKKQEGSYSRQASVSTPAADSAPESFDFYMKAMKPLQFGEGELAMQRRRSKRT